MARYPKNVGVKTCTEFEKILFDLDLDPIERLKKCSAYLKEHDKTDSRIHWLIEALPGSPFED